MCKAGFAGFELYASLERAALDTSDIKGGLRIMKHLKLAIFTAATIFRAMGPCMAAECKGVVSEDEALRAEDARIRRGRRATLRLCKSCSRTIWSTYIHRASSTKAGYTGKQSP